jgi:3-phosphoshikimate 1-carboxyvinyltransferase
MSEAYPDTLHIEPLTRPPTTRVRVPGSKSISNRALVLAALGEPGPGSKLCGVLRSEDTLVMIAALQALGFAVQTDWQSSTVQVRRDLGTTLIPAREANLYVANSGTTMRFLTALASLGQGRYRLDGVPRMRERPIEDLLAALRQLGVHASSEQNNGCPPVVIEADGLAGGRVRMRGDMSSQFLSGLLMAAPLARTPLTIEVEGLLVSVPYVTMTVEMMRRFGASVETDGATHFHVATRNGYRAQSYTIEPDATAASYFFGAAALTGGEVTVLGLTDDSLQGDVRFLHVLEQMGCQVTHGPKELTVRGGPLRGISANMNDISDCVMTVAAVACFAEGPTTIHGVAHIRHKETDRLRALATELRRVGAGVEEFADGLTIHPQHLHGAIIETYNDHRMAMSMALIGLEVPGLVIKDPGCVSKTYPHFFDDLERLRN